LLPAAIAGHLTGVTAFSPVAAIEETLATSMLDTCAAAAGAEVSVHCCGTGLPWKVLQKSAIRALSVDAETLRTADLEAIAEFVDSGRVVILGVVSSSTPARRPAVEEIAGAVVAVTDRLGFARTALRDRIGVSPACGLAAATPQWARTATGLARQAAQAFADDPDAI
jgi:methionine synthase II (cobalamin-independent)